MRTGDGRDRLLERGVVERVDLPAGAADQMVVVLASRLRRLEAGETFAKVDPVDQPEDSASWSSAR